MLEKDEQREKLSNQSIIFAKQYSNEVMAKKLFNLFEGLHGKR